MTRRMRLAAVLCVLAISTSGMLFAHDSQLNRNRNRGYGMGAQQQGYEYGFRAGAQHGRADRDSRAGHDYQDENYRRADLGYDRSMGDRNEYKRSFREGYKAGYDEAYNGSGGFGGILGRGNGRGVGNDRVYRDREVYQDRGIYRDGAVYGQGTGFSGPGFELGYREGSGAGREDAERGKAYSLESHGSWRDGDNGYRSSYGNKEEYRRQYRAGYERGYGETYRTRR